MNENDIKEYLKNHLYIKLSDEFTNWDNSSHILRVKILLDDQVIDSDYIDIDDLHLKEA